MNQLALGDWVIAGDWAVLVKLILALALAIPIGWDRERNSRIMGLRTFPLVSLGACGYIVLAQTFIGPADADAMARIVQGLMTGIGFVGGGAIVKGDNFVVGTASAASIWITGALGASVALGYLTYAISLSVLNFIILLVFSRLKAEIETEVE